MAQSQRLIQKATKNIYRSGKFTYQLFVLLTRLTWLSKFTWHLVQEQWPVGHKFAISKTYVARAFAIVEIPWHFVHIVLPKDGGVPRPKYEKLRPEVLGEFMRDEGSSERLAELQVSGYSRESSISNKHLPCGVLHPSGFYIVDGRHRVLTLYAKAKFRQGTLRAKLIA